MLLFSKSADAEIRELGAGLREHGYLARTETPMYDPSLRCSTQLFR